MSSIEKAKKQAKRLHSLAKDLSNDKQNIQLPLSKFNSALTTIAIINGYPSWHNYKLNLERQDLIKNNINGFNEKNIHNGHNIKDHNYFIQNIPLLTVNTNNKTNHQSPMVNNTSKHIPIVIGNNRQGDFLLTDYPLFLQGDIGSGKTNTLMSFSNQYISNNEGVIYFDGKGDRHLYHDLFSLTKNNDRMDDLYFLALFPEEDHPTHKIDPINSMYDNLNYFQSLFGFYFGSVIYSIVNKTVLDGKLLPMNSLPAMLMLNNLVELADNGNTFIKKYLHKIDYNGVIDDLLIERHAIYCQKAQVIFDYILSSPNCFSHEAEINMIDIFKNKKILLIQSFSFEKANLDIDILNISLKIIYHCILFTDLYLKEKSFQFYQNIIFDDFNYFLNDERELYNFDIIKHSANNYILTSNSFSEHNYKTNDKNKNVLALLESCKTFALMRIEGRIPLTIKFNALNNMTKFSPIFYAESHNDDKSKKYHLNKLHEGDIFIFCDNKEVRDPYYINHEQKYYITKINADYLKIDKINDLYLIQH